MTENEYLRQLHTITKQNSALMSQIKWRESIASNLNPTDGLCKYSSTSLIWPESMHGSFIKKQVE